MRRIPLACAAALWTAFYTASVCRAQMPEVNQGTVKEAVSQAIETFENGDVADAPAETCLNLIDQKLALSLVIETLAQVEMAEFALKSIDHEALRELAAGRLGVHRALLSRLEGLTDGRCNVAIAKALDEIEEERRRGTKRAFSFRPLALQQQATALVVRIRLETTKEYVDLIHAELERRRGGDFDRHYLQCEVLHQMQLLAMLKVFEGQASTAFAPVIHQASKDTRDHLARAKQLLLQFETAPPTSVAGTPRAVIETADVQPAETEDAASVRPAEARLLLEAAVMP